MSEIFARAQATDKRCVTSTLLGGSTKKLTSTGDYIGMSTVLNHADDDVLVKDPEMFKSVTREYWSKLYTQQNTLDVPKLWLLTPSVVAVRKQIEKEPFQWPVPLNITDF